MKPIPPFAWLLKLMFVSRRPVSTPENGKTNAQSTVRPHKTACVVLCMHSSPKAIGNCFERANIPTLTEEQRIAALTFAVVGAGPTGVECCAELRDFIEEVRLMRAAVFCGVGSSSLYLTFRQLALEVDVLLVFVFREIKRVGCGEVESCMRRTASYGLRRIRLWLAWQTYCLEWNSIMFSSWRSLFVSQEGPRFYPHLLKYVRIKLIEAR